MHRCFPIAGLMLLLALPPGCGPMTEATDQTEFVPVDGTVKVDGQPLEGAVVTFLQTDQQGTTGLGETDAEGKYTLSAMLMPGIAPGRYKVGISYQMAPSGRTVGLSARSSLAPNPDAYAAKELLPPKYSDLGQTTLDATVPPDGGTIDFDLDGPLLDPPPSTAGPAGDDREDHPASPDNADFSPSPGDGVQDAPAPDSEPGAAEDGESPR